MSKTKKPTPYDPKLVAAQCDPSALRLGCAAGCWKGENFDMCGKPPVAIRRWHRPDDRECAAGRGPSAPPARLHRRSGHDPQGEGPVMGTHA